MPTKLLSMSDAATEPSAPVRERILAARTRQAARRTDGGPLMNADLEGRDLYLRGAFTSTALNLLAQAADRFGLSARAHERALRVARTIADLSGEEAVSDDHLAEALHFR